MSRKKVWRVELSAKDRLALGGLTRKGKAAAREMTRARVLLLLDEGKEGSAKSIEEVGEATGLCERSLLRLRKVCCEQGPMAAVRHRTPVHTKPKKLDGEGEARLVALACSKAPDGRSQWSLRLLAEKMVELEIVDEIAHETVRRVLKKNALKPWLKAQWCIPPKENAAFVCAMEDILSVYTRARDPRFPLVCMDESSRQLLGDVREPLPPMPCRVKKVDHEYIRQGTANLFMLFAPLLGWRHVKVTERRTRIDWAHLIRELCDVHYPSAQRIVLVLDNLNTHAGSSLYEAFAAAEARRLYERLEIHYTPKHGSWLNMAEIELSVLQRQCLRARVPDIASLTHQVAAWSTTRNNCGTKTEWRFTTPNARIKLKHLYPQLLK